VNAGVTITATVNHLMQVFDKIMMMMMMMMMCGNSVCVQKLTLTCEIKRKS